MEQDCIMTKNLVDTRFDHFKSYKSYNEWIESYRKLLYNLDDTYEYSIFYSPEHFCISVEWESKYANLQLLIYENSFNFSIFNKCPIDKILKIDSVYDLKQKIDLKSINLINELVKTHFEYTLKLEI